MQTRSAATCVLVGLALLAPQVNRIAHGSHLPAAAADVWRVVSKVGSASAVPVATKGDLVFFLTAKHVAEAIGAPSIVESRDKLRKLPILKYAVHATEDIAILAVQAKGVELVKLATEAPVPGVSVFSIGYAAPHRAWLGYRGYTTAEPTLATTSIFYGMSGGAMMLNDGRLLGILIARPIFGELPAPGQTTYVPLSQVTAWLKASKILE